MFIEMFSMNDAVTKILMRVYRSSQPYVPRTKHSKGCLSRNGMLHMMFKLGQCAEQNWRKLRGFDYLAKVITGVTFKDGIETTETGQIAA